MASGVGLALLALGVVSGGAALFAAIVGLGILHEEHPLLALAATGVVLWVLIFAVALSS